MCLRQTDIITCCGVKLKRQDRLPTMADVDVRTFVAADYVVFGLMLVVSAAIGVYYAVWGGKQTTTKEFLMADRSMKILPVAISILVSFMSAILILGTPAEMYTNGTEYILYTIGVCVAITLSTVLFVPLLFNLRLTSSFEVSF